MYDLKSFFFLLGYNKSSRIIFGTFFHFFSLMCLISVPFFLPWSFWLTYYIDWQKNKCTLKWKKSNFPQSKKCCLLICILQTVADRRFVIFFCTSTAFNVAFVVMVTQAFLLYRSCCIFGVCSTVLWNMY